MKGDVLARGASADIIEWDALRVAKLFFPSFAHLADDEAVRTSAARGAGIGVPAVHGVENFDGRKALVLDRVVGPTLLSTAARDAPSAARELARLHRLIHDRTSSRLRSWQSVVAEISHGMDAKARSDFASLLVDVPDGDRVYHGDFHPGNVLLGDDGPVIVDWPNACTAHPASDVARTILLTGFQGLAESPTRLLVEQRRAFARCYFEAYEASEPGIGEQVERCLPLHAAGLLRAELSNAHASTLASIADRRCPDPLVTLLDLGSG